MTTLTPLQEQFLQLARNCGVKAITCIAPEECSGYARLNEDGQYEIMVRGDPRNPMFLFVIFHEVAHIVLRHAGRWTSQPAWQKEYAADQWALDMVKVVSPETFRVCEKNSKRRMRHMLQPWIVADDPHFDRVLSLDIIDWCGARITRAHRARLAAQYKEWADQRGIPDDGDIPF